MTWRARTELAVRVAHVDEVKDFCLPCTDFVVATDERLARIRPTKDAW